MSTVLDKRAPWETYHQSLDEKLTPTLQAEIEEYSKKRHYKTSEQNEEELARWREENKYLSKQYQFLTPEEYENEGARIGRILHSSTVISMLQKLGLQCWYKTHPQKDKLTILILKGTKLEVGCWITNGYMPEYSIIRFDDHGVPLNEKYRGWRTVLLQLILKGYIPERETHRLFRKASGIASTRYNSTLFDVRNRYVKTI